MIRPPEFFLSFVAAAIDLVNRGIFFFFFCVRWEGEFSQREFLAHVVWCFSLLRYSWSTKRIIHSPFLGQFSSNVCALGSFDYIACSSFSAGLCGSLSLCGGSEILHNFCSIEKRWVSIFLGFFWGFGFYFGSCGEIIFFFLKIELALFDQKSQTH